MKFTKPSGNKLLRRARMAAILASLPRAICDYCGDTLAWTKADKDIIEESGPKALMAALKGRRFICHVCANYTPPKQR